MSMNIGRERGPSADYIDFDQPSRSRSESDPESVTRSRNESVEAAAGKTPSSPLPIQLKAKIMDSPILQGEGIQRIGHGVRAAVIDLTLPLVFTVKLTVCLALSGVYALGSVLCRDKEFSIDSPKLRLLGMDRDFQAAKSMLRKPFKDAKEALQSSYESSGIATGKISIKSQDKTSQSG